MKLYTALGMCKDVETPQGCTTIISVGKKAYRPKTPEMIIWTLLLWNVMAFDELRAAYEEMMESHHISEDISFEWFLQHLENEEVIASGEDVDFENTCYALFRDRVIVVPSKLSYLQKIAAFVREVVWYRCPVHIAATIFKKPNYPDLHLKIMDIARDNHVTTAELVRYFELGGRGNLFETVYAGQATRESVAIQSRFDVMRLITLTAVAELFLDRKIMLINR